jgi:predicted nucleotidyltransferase
MRRPEMDEDVDQLMGDLVEQVRGVEGVAAVVLGGSRARNTHTPASDIDLGIYYDPAVGLDITGLDRVAQAMDDAHRPGLVTAIGGWGPWINGGGWLTVQGIAVDFLYRDLHRVQYYTEAATAGQIEFVYQPGHPLGFASYIYMSEIAVCRAYWDPRGVIAQLKRQTVPYPPRLKEAIIRQFWWEADFSLQIARKALPRGDITYVAGCCFRAVGCVLQTLFALNEQYWLNEKGATAIAANFSLGPSGLQARIGEAFSRLAPAPAALVQGIEILSGLIRETDALVRAHAPR